MQAIAMSLGENVVMSTDQVTLFHLCYNLVLSNMS